MPRKTAGARVRADPRDPASMRPRPDAAENHRTDAQVGGEASSFNEAAARCRGKPRPAALRPVHVAAASMRPRPDAAENRYKGVWLNRRDDALQ